MYLKKNTRHQQSAVRMRVACNIPEDDAFKKEEEEGEKKNEETVKDSL
jgi:hypothetical protein